jgi:GNAT superfamily N-acetyltransferase
MLEIRELQEQDISEIVEAFELLDWDKPASQYEKYLAEQDADEREVLVAFENGKFAGYLTILWESDYPPFQTEQIPEIQDFNVLPNFRRRGIGTKLMDEAENIVSESSNLVGIGVGLTSDYGAAQRLYVSRGYEPDGNGITWRNSFPKYGDPVIVDDDLNLHFTKKL